jgi:putative nucleotidyltransferase with HDIG domain
VKLIGSFEDDVARRDFTINAMGMDHELEIYDFHGGLEDIQKRLIRTVGDPMERFNEDAIRMIRAARFAALLDFDIEPQTRRAIKRLFRNIQKIKVERIVLELVKAAKGTGQQFARFILLLDELKLLYQILPEVVAMKYFRHDLAHHPEGPTVFDHSIECLKVLEESSNFVAKMATLLHDVGKPISFQEETHWWKFSYHRHEKKSAELARDICLRLKFSTDDLEAIVFAAKNHMKFHNILKMKPSKIARLVSDPHFDVLLHVARADEFSRGEKFIHKDQFDQAVKKIAEIEERWRNRMVKNEIKLVSGHRIMKLLSLQPGKIVGVIKGVVEDRILDEQLDPDNSELIDKIILEEGKIVLGRREDEKE